MQSKFKQNPGSLPSEPASEPGLLPSEPASEPGSLGSEPGSLGKTKRVFFSNDDTVVKQCLNNWNRILRQDVEHFLLVVLFYFKFSILASVNF